MFRFAFILGLVLFTSLLHADLIHLKDGTTLEGTVKKTTGGWTVTTADGKTTTVTSDTVKSISLVGRETTATAVDDKLASLRRAVENVADIKQIISRYQNFIAQNKNTDAAKDAQKDLATWQDRQSRGLIKVGNQWITPQERDTLKEKSVAEADSIRQLIKSGQLSEADARLTKAQALDPQNAGLNFLRGLLQYRQNQIVPAKKSFEMANQQLPNHAPNLNNLGTVAVRQNQFLLALGFYDQAMLAAPQTKEVLNNVAELLNAMPAENLRTPIAQKVTQHFNDQDKQLAAKLEKEGQYRWGAQWVNAQQLEQLKAVEKEMKSKLDALSADFDAANQRIATIDTTISDNLRSMRTYESMANGYQYGTGRQYNNAQIILPGTYYDLQRDNTKLTTERAEKVAKLDELRQQARTIQKQYPVPKYTGAVKLIDVEGTPVDLPNNPQISTTQPAPAATQPAGATTQPGGKRTGWKV
jgi:Tfp pilus assembly protein PilF